VVVTFEPDFTSRLVCPIVTSQIIAEIRQILVGDGSQDENRTLDHILS
jgi:hypothetical protein